MTRTRKATATHSASEFGASLRKGVLLGAAVLVLILPPTLSFLPTPPQSAAPPVAAATGIKQPAQPPSQVQRPAARSAGPRQLAQFGRTKVSSEVRQMANWVVHSSDHKAMSFVIVDKKQAKVYLFNPKGRLKASTPALLGAAPGDDSAPGIGDKPLSQVLADEKTTPAGRFIAELGMNTNGEDIVWVDYDAAVSMHRVRANVKAERRLERLASPTAKDNRISFGCINLPPRFYEQVLKPTVEGTGAVIYVLPETRSLHDMFASFYDVKAPVKMAQR